MAFGELAQNPNPQSPIPNPQIQNKNKLFFNFIINKNI
jgi:hypothetical protein